MASPNTPGCVYLLADHLDMLLAAGEDIQKIEFVKVETAADADEQTLSIQDFVRHARELEHAAIGRLMCARTQASQLEGEDERFSMLARLFLAGTAHVSDVLQHFQDREVQAFDCGSDPIDYLRSHGLVAEDTGCLSIVEKLTIGEDFLLGGHIELGPLLDLCAQFLDSLDAQFGLFPEVPAATEIKSDVSVGRPAFF